MKRVFPFMAAVMIMLSLNGCGKYSSSYKAVGFVHSNESTSSFMTFESFEGRMVFKLKSTGEGDLKYTAKLETGSATVYYDYSGGKTELFSVKSGNELVSRGGYIEAGTVYVIVETEEKCINGDFRFSID